MLAFSLCNKKGLAIQHVTLHFSNDTIDSVLRHREVGQAEDFSTPPHINEPQVTRDYFVAVISVQSKPSSMSLYVHWRGMIGKGMTHLPVM